MQQKTKRLRGLIYTSYKGVTLKEKTGASDVPQILESRRKKSTQKRGLS